MLCQFQCKSISQLYRNIGAETAGDEGDMSPNNLVGGTQ